VSGYFTIEDRCPNAREAHQLARHAELLGLGAGGGDELRARSRSDPEHISTDPPLCLLQGKPATKGTQFGHHVEREMP